MEARMIFTAGAPFLTAVLAFASSYKCVEKCILKDADYNEVLSECRLDYFDSGGDKWKLLNIVEEQKSQLPGPPRSLKAVVKRHMNDTVLVINAIYKRKRLNSLKGILIEMKSKTHQSLQYTLEVQHGNLNHLKNRLAINVMINLKCSKVQGSDTVVENVAVTSLPISRKCQTEQKKCRTRNTQVGTKWKTNIKPPRPIRCNNKRGLISTLCKRRSHRKTRKNRKKNENPPVATPTAVVRKTTTPTKQLECPRYSGAVKNVTTPESVSIDICSTDIQGYFIDQALLICENDPRVNYNGVKSGGNPCNYTFDNVNFTCGGFILKFSVICLDGDQYSVRIKQPHIIHSSGITHPTDQSQNSRTVDPLEILLPLSLILGLSTVFTICIICYITQHRREISRIRNCKDFGHLVMNIFMKKKKDTAGKDEILSLSPVAMILSFFRDDHAYIDCIQSCFDAVGIKVIHPESNAGNEAMKSYPDWLENLVTSCNHFIFLVSKDMYEQLDGKQTSRSHDTESHFPVSSLYTFNLIRQEFEKHRMNKKRCHLVSLGSDNEEYMQKLSRFPFFYIHEAETYKIFFQSTEIFSTKTSRSDDCVSFNEMERLVCNIQKRK